VSHHREPWICLAGDPRLDLGGFGRMGGLVVDDLNWRHLIAAATRFCGTLREAIDFLERVQQKWEPVLHSDTRQNKELKQEEDSKKGRSALMR
jgi:hypothetical protein